MRTTMTWLKRVALLIALSALTATAVSAQTVAAAELETTLSPGMLVWITDSTGREEKARIRAGGVQVSISF